MTYFLTIDQTGHDEGFAICNDKGQIAYIPYHDSDSEKDAERDAQLIANALNAYTVLPAALQALKLCHTLIRRDGVRPDIMEGILLHERAEIAAKDAMDELGTALSKDQTEIVA